MRPNLLIVGVVLTATLASAQHCHKINIDKSSGFCTVPDSGLTPGSQARSGTVGNDDQ
jgi:hypothetical protein